MTRQEHIEQLAEELRVEISYTAGRYGQAAHHPSRTLLLAPWGADVPEEENYWVALHELGHIAMLDAGDPSHEIVEPESFEEMLALLSGGPNRGRRAAEAEAAAWAWALDTAIFPLDQAGESSIAWGLADRLREGWEPGPNLERIARELGSDPDWFFNVTEPEHWAKLDGYARPRWRTLAEHYGVKP